MDTKLCTNCWKEKTVEEFHYSKERGHQAWCKSCKKERDRNYYWSKKEKRKAQNKKWWADYVEWYRLLKTSPCHDCGGSFDPVCMQWDHLPGERKIESVAVLFGKGNKSAILEEIRKCELVCANCHALRTHNRLG